MRCNEALARPKAAAKSLCRKGWCEAHRQKSAHSSRVVQSRWRRHKAGPCHACKQGRSKHYLPPSTTPPWQPSQRAGAWQISLTEVLFGSLVAEVATVDEHILGQECELALFIMRDLKQQCSRPLHAKEHQLEAGAGREACACPRSQPTNVLRLLRGSSRLRKGLTTSGVVLFTWCKQVSQHRVLLPGVRSGTSEA